MQKTTQVDYLIIGAGPAGLQLGYYLQEAGRDYLILEAGETPGTFFKTFPRHGKLISINKVYTGRDDPEANLRTDWNSLLSDNPALRFKHYTQAFFPSAADLVRYLGDFAAQHELHVAYQTQVVRIGKDENFQVFDQAGNCYLCRYLIIATGLAKAYQPAIPGIELAESYRDVSINPQDFINQRVLIIGKGNSAFETADNLVETTATIHLASPHSLKLAWQTHFPGHLRAVNNNLLDTYQLKSQNAILDVNIEKIERRGDQLAVAVRYNNVDDHDLLLYDRVIACTGFCFDNSLFAETCRPALTYNNRLPAQTSAWESTNINNLYFAGALMQMRDYKKTTSAFIHGFRYNVRALHRLLEQRNHQQAWPQRNVGSDAHSLMQAVIERVNRTSALWQQFGFLCDMIQVADDGACYYEELPVDYVKESHFGTHPDYYTITLEYGDLHDEVDPFHLHRPAQTDIENAHQSKYLHPIIRHYNGTTLVGEHHVAENLENDWNRVVHTEPLAAFFQAQLMQS